MAVHGPSSPQEWMDGVLVGGVTPTLDGALENTPNNRIVDAAMRDLAPGGTKTARLLTGSRLEGHHFYSTPDPDPAPPRQSELVKQTGIPQDPAATTRLEEQSLAAVGQRPRAPFDPSLPQLVVRKVPLAASKQGFAGGWRLAAVGGRTKGGAYTTTTTPVAFQHGNGQHLEWYPPAEASPGVHEWVLFLSEEAATEAALKASTMREADRARVGTRIALAKGPHDRKAKKRPTTNETMLGRDDRPRWGEELRVAGHVGRGRERKNAPGDMEEMDNASVAFVFHTPRGPSEAGQRSRARDLKAKKDHALFVRPKRPPEDATGVTPYLFLGGASYRVVRPGLVYKGRPFPIDEWVPIYGNVGTEGESGASRGRGYATALVQEDPPEEDASGVEPPTGEADPPVGKGVTRPAAGAYWKTYAPVYGGVEGRAAVPVKETISASEMLLLEVPNPVNRLANPAGSARGADGLPYSWGGNLQNGVVSDATGKLGVATSGLVNDTAAGTPYRQSDPVPVNQGVVETVRGTLEVSGYAGSAGAGQVRLSQTLADGSTLPGIVLASRTSAGSTPFEKTVGPVGSGADVILDEGATDWALRIGTDASAGRNMTVRAYDLAIHPFDGAPRKFVFPPEGSAEMAGPDAPPEAPYPPGPVVCITRPRSAAAPPSFVPVGTLTAPANPAPSGWGQTKTNNANVGLELGAPYRAFSNATGTRAQAFYSKTYPIGTGAGFVNGSSLAARGPFAFPVLPTRSGNQLVHLAILDASDRFMGYVRALNGGTVQLVARNANGKDFASSAVTGLSPSDVADCEVIVGGGGTKGGRVSLVGSVGGGPRDELASIEGIDFANRVPRQVRFMGVYEKDTAGKWEVTCPWLRVTSSGDVVEEFAVDPLPADRPTGADGFLREIQTVDGEDLPTNHLYIHIPPGFEGEERGMVFDDFFVFPERPQTLAVYARWEDLSAQATDTVRLTVFDAGGNEWVAPSPIPAGVSGTQGWTDLLSHLTPPAGFFRARLRIIRTEAGMLLAQEPMSSDGTL